MKKILMASITCMLLLVAGCKFAGTPIDRNQMADLTAKNDLYSDTPSAGVSVAARLGGSGTSSFVELTFTLGVNAVKLDATTVTSNSFKLYKVESDPAPVGKAVAKTVTVSLSAENEVKIAFDSTGDSGDYIVYADAEKVRFSNSALRMNGNQNNVIDEAADSFLYIDGPNAATLSNYRKMYYDGSFPFTATGYKDETVTACAAGDTTMLLTATPLTFNPVQETLNANLKIQKWNYETAKWDSVAATFAVKSTAATPATFNVIATVPAMKEMDMYRLVTDNTEAIQYTTGVSDGAGLATISGKYSKTGEISDAPIIAVGVSAKSEYALLSTIVSNGLSFEVVKEASTTPYLEVKVEGVDVVSFNKITAVWQKIKDGNTATTRTVQFFLASGDSSSIPLSVNYEAGRVTEKTETKSVTRFPITNVFDTSSGALGVPNIYVSNSFKLPNTLAGDAYTAEVYPFTAKYPQPGSPIFPAKNWSKM